MDDVIAVIIDGITYYYHKDHLGSIVGITDSNGNLVSSYEYDSFGNFQITGTDVGNDRLFTGREYDRETGLYYYRARYYDSKLGRFISRDPIDISDNVNLYTYVGNNPVMFSNPSGLEAKQIISNSINYISNIINTIDWDNIKYNAGEKIRNTGLAISASTLPECVSTSSIAGGCSLALSPTGAGMLSCSPIAVTAGATCGATALGAGMAWGGNYMMNSSGNGGKGNTGGISKTVVNTEVKGGKARVDVEYPTGGSSGNVHVQFKGKGGNYKEYLNSIEDLSKLPKDIRNNNDIINGVNKAFRNLENAQKTMK